MSSRVAPDQKQRVTLTVNGKVRSGFAEPRMLLTDFLRHELQLFGVHVGCEHGVCGACTIILDREAVRSCLMFAVQARGKKIRTVEGLAQGDRLHPLQQAFHDAQGFQCGFLSHRGHVRGGMALQLNHRGGHRGRPEDKADAPARHRIGLGKRTCD